MIERIDERSAPEELISEEQISDRVKQIGRQITDDYNGRQLTLLVVLKGGYIYAADLIRKIDTARVDVEVEFVQISTYKDGTESNHNPIVMPAGEFDLSGRNVLIVEDIVDTGYSIKALKEYCEDQGVSSLRSSVMVSKLGRREVDVHIDYIGFEIPNVWVEGYGLDSDQKGRGYPFVGVRSSS